VNDIHLLLKRIEAHHGVRIVYACESGSRAWGFASPDSDFDIRFLFVRPESSYLSAWDGLAAIDLPLEGLLDAGGWDVRKAARLLATSNAALLEWLHSPTVYLADEGFLGRWRATGQAVFSPQAVFHHYRGLAKQMVLGKLTGDSVRAKDYLYALRAVLGAQWVAAGRGIPPVDFMELVPTAPAAVRDELPGLLEHKSRTGEGARMERLAGIDEFLKGFLNVAVEEFAFPPATPDPEAIDELLRREIRGTTSMLTAEEFTLQRVRERDLLLFDSVAGSHAYGTAIAGSDHDRRGVFVAPRGFLLGLDGIEQVSDARSDEVYYELGQFVTLLLKGNPNALELLAMPEDCVRYRHPLFARLKPELFLTKLCANTFGEYAMGQIRKARGLNKKIVNPQPEQRLAMLDFCHIPQGQGSLPVLAWLAERTLDPRHCGLTAVRHADGIFALYVGEPGTFRGLVSPKDPDSLIFSSVPRDAEPLGWIHFNRDAFRAHCKAHREYWEWVRLRNEERFTNNAQHGRGYDSKNLMHTLRLLDMAAEIARDGILRVRRPNRDFLLRVRSGEFAYDDLVAGAENQLVEVRVAFESSSLPDRPDRAAINRLLVEIREEFQSGKSP